MTKETVEAGEKPGFPEVPKIENIHQKIHEATKGENALNMETWHTCDTTHCRAGWVVQLAGETGRKLGKVVGTAHAAQLIYKDSSIIPVSPVRFYENNETAMKDIVRCAELEKTQPSKQ